MQLALKFCCYVFGIGWALDAFVGPSIAYLLPLFKWLFMLIDSHFEVIDEQITRIGDAQVIAFKVTLSKPFWLGRHFVAVNHDGIAQVSTSLMHLWKSLAVCVAVILSWPSIRLKKRLLALVYGLLFSMLVWCIDVPFVLLAALWQMIETHYAIQETNYFFYWQAILENGGRLMLGLLSACMACVLTQAE